MCSSTSAVETYSVLTRLPPPLVLAPAGYVEVLRLAATAGILGGAVYDAVVAATADEVGAELLTLDERAARAYELVGVDYRFVR